jgi:hypothetical protein
MSPPLRVVAQGAVVMPDPKSVSSTPPPPRRGIRFRRALSRALLRIETGLTVLPFLASWLGCAIGFAVVAGYQMAKAASEQEKASVLEKVLGHSDDAVK